MVNNTPIICGASEKQNGKRRCTAPNDKTVATFSDARFQPAIVAMSAGKLWITGGSIKGHVSLNTSEIIDLGMWYYSGMSEFLC